MTELNAQFTPPNSSKRYLFNLAPQADLKTVIKQFRLDLPSKYQLTDLRLRVLNGVEPKSDPDINSMEFFKALLLLQQNHPLAADEYNRLYVAKKQLSTVRIRNAFKDASAAATEVTYSPYWFYIFAKPLKSNKTNTQAAGAATSTEPAISEIRDFNALQARALKLEQEYQDLQQGADSYQQVMQHADETNIMLTKQLEKLDQKQQKRLCISQKRHEFLKKNYSRYLQTDDQKIALLINLLQNAHQPNVQQLTHGQSKKLWNLVKAICDYD